MQLNFRITCIELSHDFYNVDLSLITALFKSLEHDNRIRLFRSSNENRSIPESPIVLKQLIEDGFNIRINDYRKDFTIICTTKPLIKMEKHCHKVNGVSV